MSDIPDCGGKLLLYHDMLPSLKVRRMRYQGIGHSELFTRSRHNFIATQELTEPAWITAYSDVPLTPLL